MRLYGVDGKSTQVSLFLICAYYFRPAEVKVPVELMLIYVLYLLLNKIVWYNAHLNAYELL